MRSLFLIALSGWLAVCAARAHAEEAGDKAAAEALFDAGRRLLRDGKLPEACAKFEASQKLDPGVGTLLNLADCYEKRGMTASAWAQFREAAAAARRAGSVERENIARQRAKDLEARLSYLTITVWQGQTVEVTRDGEPVGPAQLGVAIPMDPGSHTISANAPEKRSWSTEVAIGDDGDRVSVTVPILPDELPPSAAGEPRAEALGPVRARPRPAQAASSGGGAQRALAVVAGSIGVVGLGLGIGFGLHASSTWADAQRHCDPKPYCGPQGKKLADEASTSALVSTIGFAAFAAGVTGGLVLWLTAPDSDTEAPVALQVSPGAITLLGRY